MSKMDNLRAMREARYEAAKASAAKTATAPKAKQPATRQTKTTEAIADVPDVAPDGLCGHRNMSGRSCTREKGHSAKSHRYS